MYYPSTNSIQSHRKADLGFGGKKKKKSLKDGDIIFSSMKLGLVRKSDLTLSFQIVLRFKNMLDEKYCGNGL